METTQKTFDDIDFDLIEKIVKRNNPSNGAGLPAFLELFTDMMYYGDDGPSWGYIEKQMQPYIVNEKFNFRRAKEEVINYLKSNVKNIQSGGLGGSWSRSIIDKALPVSFLDSFVSRIKNENYNWN